MYGTNHDAFVTHTEYLIRTNVGKLFATAVVMVWNFLTRKWLPTTMHTTMKPPEEGREPLERRGELEAAAEQFLAQQGLVAG